jgi:Ca2+-transporting ATPase
VATLYAFGLWMQYDEKTLRGVIFTALMIANLSLILTNRSLKETILESLFRNYNPTLKWLLGGVLSFIVVILYTPIISRLFKIHPLSFSDFLIAVLTGMLSIAWFEIFKTFKSNEIGN